jgi:hypothetical protein
MSRWQRLEGDASRRLNEAYLVEEKDVYNYINSALDVKWRHTPNMGDRRYKDMNS